MGLICRPIKGTRCAHYQGDNESSQDCDHGYQLPYPMPVQARKASWNAKDDHAEWESEHERHAEEDGVSGD